MYLRWRSRKAFAGDLYTLLANKFYITYIVGPWSNGYQCEMRNRMKGKEKPYLFF